MHLYAANVDLKSTRSICRCSFASEAAPFPSCRSDLQTPYLRKRLPKRTPHEAKDDRTKTGVERANSAQRINQFDGCRLLVCEYDRVDDNLIRQRGYCEADGIHQTCHSYSAFRRTLSDDFTNDNCIDSVVYLEIARSYCALLEDSEAPKFNSVT